MPKKNPKDTPGQSGIEPSEPSGGTLPPLDLAGGKKWEPPEESLGQRLREARQKPGNDLSIEALSRLTKDYDKAGVGVGATTILRYEAGSVLPGAREIRILCDALEVTPNWLLLGMDDPRSPSAGEILAHLVQMAEKDLCVSNHGRWWGAPDALRSERLARAKTPQGKK